MPWYAIVASAIYATLIAWFSVVLLEEGRKGLWIIPFLLLKFAILCVAVSYWDPNLCAIVKRIPAPFAGLAIGTTVLEAILVLKRVLLSSQGHHAKDNFTLGIIFLTAIIVPVVVLFYAGQVVLLDRCAI